MGRLSEKPAFYGPFRCGSAWLEAAGARRGSSMSLAPGSRDPCIRAALRQLLAAAFSLGSALAANGCESVSRDEVLPQGVEAPATDIAQRHPALAADVRVGGIGGREGAGSETSATGASATAREGLRTLEWAFERGPFGPTQVTVVIPGAPPAERFPVLVTFHGRGESVKGSRQGARAWLDDYALARAIARLSEPPLSSEDFEQFITLQRLSRINRELGERPYAGLIVVCPFLPDVLKGARAFEEAEPLAAFVVDELLPRVYAKTPAIGTAAATGVDGVSLGGRAALLVGLSRPAAFGSVGALQAALDPKELSRFAELAARASRDNPRLVLRLLTSDEDYFLRENERLSALLAARGVAHQLTRVPGTHSYRFNRGAGGIEMLLFHDRVLRGSPPLP